MRKKDMIGLLVYPFPGYVFTLLLKLSDFFLFCVLGDRFLMAFQADV